MKGRTPVAGEMAGPHGGAAWSERDFSLTVERRGRGRAVLVLAGELDLYRAPEVAASRKQALTTSRSPQRAGVARNHGRNGGIAMAGHRALPGETVRQIARSQALFRTINERINEIARDHGLAEGFAILCECASTECQERVELTQGEYEQLRQMPTHFAVVRDHDIPAVERVVQANDRFLTVEKLGDSGLIATMLDPRRRQT